MNDIKHLRSYLDLDVFQNAYEAMLMVHRDIIKKLPSIEEFILKDQLRITTKSIPRLIAEGHAKRYQRLEYQKFIDEALGESNETIILLNQAGDLYTHCLDIELCCSLIDLYIEINQQLLGLGENS